MSSKLSATGGTYTSKLPRMDLSVREPVMPMFSPYQQRYKLYLMHFFYAFVSRMWDMGIVLLIADLTNNSLFLVAMSGFLASLSIFLFMPCVGSMLDKTNRLAAVQWSLGIKILAVTLSYADCAYVAYGNLDSLARTLFVYALPFFGACASLCFSTITQSVEKDWIIVLSDGDSNWLSSTNSMMSQIDLLCSSFAPAVTGYLFYLCSTGDVAVILLLINGVTTLSLYLFMQTLYHSWPQLAVRTEKSTALPPGISSAAKATRYQAVETAENINSSFDSEEFSATYEVTSCICFKQIRNALSDFFSSGCAGVMVAYAFLYFTVLSFGSLMTVYLLWAGVTQQWIGISRGGAALTGFTGAALFPYVSQWLGLYVSGQVAIVYQCALVVFAASSFFWASGHASAWIMIVCVLFSRTGLWMFDLCARQIAQETIPEQIRGKVNGQWRSMIAFFDMGVYAAALVIPDPQHFWILCLVSASMVFLAMLTFTASNLYRSSCGVLCCGQKPPPVLGYETLYKFNQQSQVRKGGSSKGVELEMNYTSHYGVNNNNNSSNKERGRPQNGYQS